MKISSLQAKLVLHNLTCSFEGGTKSRAVSSLRNCGCSMAANSSPRGTKGTGSSLPSASLSTATSSSDDDTQQTASVIPASQVLHYHLILIIYEANVYQRHSSSKYIMMFRQMGKTILTILLTVITESHMKLILATLHFLEDSAQIKHCQHEHGKNCLGGSS